MTFVHLERGSRRVEYSVCGMVQHVACMQEEHRRLLEAILIMLFSISCRGRYAVQYIVTSVVLV